jgi:nicotinamide phosphoribosyltransferase
MFFNPATACDFYKIGHFAMYPKGITKVVSNFTPRSNTYATNKADKVVVFGLQGFIKQFLIGYWTEFFFKLPKEIVISEYNRRNDVSLGKGSVNSDHIAALHDLGYLPIKIKALPEGSLVPTKVPVLTIENTHPDFYWLPNYLETALSAELWKPMTTATTAYQYRKLLEDFAETTGAPKDFVLWQGHDFSLRGLSGLSDAASSAGHLLSFLGTDTIPAIDYLEVFYDARDSFVGGSVPATEHSVMCAGGQATERDTFKRLITEVHPSGVVSIVSDTWNYWDVLTKIAPSLKEEILNRTPNELGLAKVVFRPDSGDPVEILCGIDVFDLSGGADNLEEAMDWAEEMLSDKVRSETPHGEWGPTQMVGYFRFANRTFEAKLQVEWNRSDYRFYYVEKTRLMSFEEVTLTAEQKGSVEVLWDEFGGTLTDKGYKMLNQRVGLIYGDSITYERANQILTRLAAKGFASSNVVFGIGSYTYQYVTRDTHGFAMKATYCEIDGVGMELFKDPATDNGVKKSAKGLLRVEQEGDTFVLYDQQTKEQAEQGALEVVFENGRMMKFETLDGIRDRINKSL